MELRQAILLAADAIETEPKRFNFISSEVKPIHNCTSPMCFIGWVAAFMEVDDPVIAFGRDGGLSVLGVDESTVYDRMNQLETEKIGQLAPRRWLDDAKVCAAMARFYADKYHPAPKE